MLWPESDCQQRPRSSFGFSVAWTLKMLGSTRGSKNVLFSFACRTADTWTIWPRSRPWQILQCWSRTWRAGYLELRAAQLSLWEVPMEGCSLPGSGWSTRILLLGKILLDLWGRVDFLKIKTGCELWSLHWGSHPIFWFHSLFFFCTVVVSSADN